MGWLREQVEAATWPIGAITAFVNRRANDIGQQRLDGNADLGVFVHGGTEGTAQPPDVQRALVVHNFGNAPDVIEHSRGAFCALSGGAGTRRFACGEAMAHSAHYGVELFRRQALGQDCDELLENGNIGAGEERLGVLRDAVCVGGLPDPTAARDALLDDAVTFEGGEVRSNSVSRESQGARDLVNGETRAPQQRHDPTSRTLVKLLTPAV